MGYYTSYGISLEGDPSEIEAFEKDLLEVSKYGGENEPDGSLVELLDFGGAYAKLYDLPDWIGEVAKKHPNVLVILTGDGEESFDIWEERWKGEDNERQEYTIPPFTKTSLLTESELQNRTITL